MRHIKDMSTFIARAPTDGPRVLVADIETLPIKAYVWSCFKTNVGVEQIEDDFKLMSFAGKWLEDRAYFYIDNRDAPGGPRDDFDSVLAAHDILANTDIVIAHNGAKFDMRKLRARMAMQELQPLQQIPVIDTLNLNRQAFAFDSQRLAFVTKHFGGVEKSQHKKYPGFELWLGCMRDELAAWNENKKYNVTDIVSNEAMYLDLRGWYQGAPNLGAYYEHKEGEIRCPNCGGNHLHRRGERRTQVGIYARYQCVDCGGWARGRTMLLSKADRSHILMN